LLGYEVEEVSTPEKTDTIQGVVKSVQDGSWIRQYILVGGVSLDVGNSYLTGENIGSVKFSDLKDMIMDARPYETSITWNFNIDDQQYKVVALPFLR
jgi:hypothetical protein